MIDKTTYIAETHARQATHDALAAVYSGADEQDADAFLDHLEDLGYRVVAK